MISNVNNFRLPLLAKLKFRKQKIKAKPDVITFAMLLFLLLQLVFWYKTFNIRPEMIIVESPPGVETVKAFAFGDEQFYYRYLAVQIQNFGDGYGIVTPLKDYDYNKLNKWFSLMDHLDPQSIYMASLAAYYFSQSQDTSLLTHMISYLEQTYELDPEKRWWWLYQAVYIAKHRLKDKDLALKIALKLSQGKGNMPMWARQMAAFIYEEKGEKEEALMIIKQILDNNQDIPEHEKSYMNYFINDRLNNIIDDAKKNNK